jgi:hypothetical protein
LILKMPEGSAPVGLVFRGNDGLYTFAGLPTFGTDWQRLFAYFSVGESAGRKQ